MNQAGKFKNIDQDRLRLIFIDGLSNLQKSLQLQFFSLVFIGFVDQGLKCVMGHQPFFSREKVKAFPLYKNIHLIKPLLIRQAEAFDHAFLIE